MAADLFHAERQTVMIKLGIAFCNLQISLKISKMVSLCKYLIV